MRKAAHLENKEEEVRMMGMKNVSKIKPKGRNMIQKY